MNYAITYALLALGGGVFYREFTKLNHFAGQTSLSFIHTHYFMLGMIVFLILMFAEKLYAFSTTKTTRYLIVYHLGLNITVIGFLMRGIPQVFHTELSKGLNASISGISGVGHILLGFSLIFILFNIRKKTA